MRSIAVFVILLLGSTEALAQHTTLRGEVVHADNRTPAVAILVEVLDVLNAVAGRTLTGSDGRFSLALASPGTFTVRALRVGYRPTVVRDFAMPDSGASIRLVLEENTIRLSAARVTTDDKCGVRSNDGGVLATAWEEVRKALASADVASSRAEFRADVTNWYSVHAPDGDSPIWQEFTRRSLDSPKPYAGVPAAEVQRTGYARPGPGGAVDYLGPDAETLTSDIFAMTHCFRLVAPQPGRPWLGIAFRPPSSRVGYAIVEIEGTFWIDTATTALRLLEYRYTNAPPAFSRIGAGGRIEFDRLTTGEWLIRRWTIRLATDVVTRRGSALSSPRSSPYVAASGGVVTSLRGDTAQLLPPPTREWRAHFVQADATASLEDATIEFSGGGQFAMAEPTGLATVSDPTPGKHTVLASTAVMRGLTLPPIRLNVEIGATGVEMGSTTIRIPGASDLLRQRCGAATEARGEAAVYGAVQKGEGPLSDADIVSVAWISDDERPTVTGQKWRADSLTLATGGRLGDYGETASPDSFGRWVACGVPRNASVRVTVTDAARRVAGVAFGRVERDDRVTRAGTLVIGRRPQ